MNKILFLLILIFLPAISNAEDVPNPNSEGMKKVQGVIIDIVNVETSRRGSNQSTTGNPGLDLGADLLESIFGTNYVGFPIYHVKVSEVITLEVASRDSFKIGDCVLVWYDGGMGDSPNLSLLGQAGIAKSSGCSKSIDPGHLFAGSMLNIHAPNSTGWQLVNSDRNGMAFAHYGTSSDESYIAQVSIFALPETKDSDEFLSLMKRGIEKDTSPDRFKSLEANYEYTETRGYSCVKFKAVTEDTKAKTSFFGSESLKLQIYSLYCRHPKRQEAGFAIVFSHRGLSFDSGLDKQAEEFIEGVQVP